MTLDDSWDWAPSAVQRFLAQQPPTLPLLASAFIEKIRRHCLATPDVAVTAFVRPDWPPFQARIYRVHFTGILFPGEISALVAAYADRSLYWLDDDASTADWSAFAAREGLMHRASQPTVLLEMLATLRGNYLDEGLVVASVDDIPWWSAQAIGQMGADEHAEAIQALEQVQGELAPSAVNWDGQGAHASLHLWSRIFGRLVRIECTFSSTGVHCQETLLGSWVGHWFAPR